MKSKDSNDKKSVSSFFWYHNGKDLRICFLVTHIIWEPDKELAGLQLHLSAYGSPTGSIFFENMHSLSKMSICLFWTNILKRECICFKNEFVFWKEKWASVASVPKFIHWILYGQWLMEDFNYITVRFCTVLSWTKLPLYANCNGPNVTHFTLLWISSIRNFSIKNQSHGQGC